MTQQSPDPLLNPNRAPTLAGVERAAAKVAALLPQTPLLPLEVDGKTVWCKAECLQPVGAFKIRGAWHRLTDLTPEQAAAGVVGVSSGNHAQGVAWAAKRLGIKATIVMPSNAPAMKLAATRQLGAEVVLYDRVTESRDEVAAKLLEQRGGTLVHAYGDPWIIETTICRHCQVVFTAVNQFAPAMIARAARSARRGERSRRASEAIAANTTTAVAPPMTT